MVTRVLALLVIATVAGAAGLLIVSTVLATQHPERSFSPASVGPGTDREVVVTITRVGAADGIAFVEETLPAGFTFKDGFEAVADASPHAKSAVSATVYGQVVTFAVLAADSVRYTVEVADDVASGSHEFTGTLKKFTGDTPITSTIMVTATPVTVTPTPTTPAPDPVNGPSRSFSPPVLPGGTNREVVVTITRVGAAGGFAFVEEILPAGFTFKSGSAMIADDPPNAKSGVDAEVEDHADGIRQVVDLVVVGADSISYTVMVADSVAAGSEYGFTGVVKKLTGETPIGGTGPTPPMPGGPSRSFSPPVLPAGTNREVVVTITRIGALAGFAFVEEALPAGFTFKSGSAMIADDPPNDKSGVDAEVGDHADGIRQVVDLVVVGADSISYTVMVADSVAAGSEYGFTGVVKKLTGETPIGGTGPTPPMPTDLSRTFAPETLAPGTNRELVVTVSGIGALNGFAQLVETLPAGFTFKDGSAEVADAAPNAKSDVVATADGQVVMIEVVAADSVRYTVSVADNVGPGLYWFRGVLKFLTREEQIDAAVISPTATPTVVVPQPTRRRSRGGGGGGGGGGYAPPVVTATPMPTRAPSAAVPTIVPTPTPIIVPTIVAPTVAPTPEPTARPEPTAVPPTAVPTPRPTARVVVPTVAPTKPPEPTAMPKPTTAPTAVPPTEVPPTAMVEPTEPPAPTATIAPTVAPVTPVTPDEGGMPTWLIILIIVIIVAVVIAAVGFYMMRMRR